MEVKNLNITKIEKSMGLFEDWREEKVEYWYDRRFLADCRFINYNRSNPKSMFYAWSGEIPLKINHNTKEVKIDWGILNLIVRKELNAKSNNSLSEQ